MTTPSPSFVGNVTLNHSTTSVSELVSRLVEPDGSHSTVTPPPIYIPSLQREFCWNQEKIEDLFDSLLRGLPIGTLLLWNVDGDEDADAEARYQFIRHYANRSNFPSGEVEERVVSYNSEKLEGDEFESEYTFTLDGQQRLSAFLIGLRGSYYAHRKNKHTTRKGAYNRKFLCLNLLNDPNREPEDARENLFEFDFRNTDTIDFVSSSDESELWYPVRSAWDSDIPLYETTDLPEDVPEGPDTHTKIEKNLTRLTNAINAQQIPVEEVSDIHSKEALELFLRRNKGGKQLSNSDMAFSLITVYWEEFEEGKDPKKEFESTAADFTEQFGKYSFSFGKGFLIRSLFYLEDERPTFDQNNLLPRKIKPLEKSWNNTLSDALQITFSLLTEEFGLTGKCVRSKTSLLPILYYTKECLRKPKFDSHTQFSESDRQKMRYWVQVTVLTDLFNIDPPTTVAHKIRPLLKGATEFPIKAILKQYNDEVIPLEISTDTDDGGEVSVRSLVKKTDHSEATTLRNYLLTAVYQDRGVGMDYPLGVEDKDERFSIDIDHFFPAAKLRNKNSALDKLKFGPDTDIETLKNDCRENVNRFGNFTLLPQNTNKSKGMTDPEEWLELLNVWMKDTEERMELIDIWVKDTEERMELIDKSERDEIGSNLAIDTHYLPDTRPYSYDRYMEFLEQRERMLIEELEDRLVFHEDVIIDK